METNVVMAIIAGSAVVISAICVLGAAVFTYTASNKKLEKIDKDLQEFFRLYVRLEAKVDAK